MCTAECARNWVTCKKQHDLRFHESLPCARYKCTAPPPAFIPCIRPRISAVKKHGARAYVKVCTSRARVLCIFIYIAIGAASHRVAVLSHGRPRSERGLRGATHPPQRWIRVRGSSRVARERHSRDVHRGLHIWGTHRPRATCLPTHTHA